MKSKDKILQKERLRAETGAAPVNQTHLKIYNSIIISIILAISSDYR
jgi:hypothetical protein